MSAKDKLKTERLEGFRPAATIGQAVILQTVCEAVGHFPDCRCIVYFAPASTFSVKGAKVEHRGARIHTLLEACRKPEEMLKPVNGHTIVFTTYPALSKRWMRKEEEPFNFKKDSDTSSKKEKAITDDKPNVLRDTSPLAPRSPQSSLTLIAYANKAICDLKGLSSDMAGYVLGLYDEKYDTYQLDIEIIDESGQTLGATKGIFCVEF
ncbi:hypothetical protein NW766_005957 [Fusarium irregulare]|uniref:Uncharacterized protein n=1 Tax=Fusarium irregulare TaxID=2494466 RepID=A0A9W8PQF6_9HYPO|nr:hypothetical protein NW766_005957 [Fusarium irregulare]